MVRDGNTAMDRGEFRDGDRGAFLDTLERWDRIFAVLDDDDHAKLVKFGFVKPRRRRRMLGASCKARRCGLQRKRPVTAIRPRACRDPE